MLPGRWPCFPLECSWCFLWLELIGSCPFSESSSYLTGSCQRRIVRVTLRASGIGCSPIEPVQRGALSNALRQIGVGDEHPAERDGIGQLRLEHLDCRLGAIAAGGDNRSVECMTEQRGVVGAVDAHVIPITGGRRTRLDHVEIREPAFAELADDVGEMWH